MRRALGGGPEALALALAAVWLLGTAIVPLLHSVEHLEPRATAGHCHGAICHDVDASGTDAAAVRDGSLPDLGSFALSHGDATALLPLPFALVAPALALVPAQPPLLLLDRRTSRSPSHASARGPPV